MSSAGWITAACVALLAVVAVVLACGSAAPAAPVSPSPLDRSAGARPGADVYALGAFNLIMRSGNGGATWAQVHRGSGASLGVLLSATFASPECGWAVGNLTSILATRDRGMHWVSQYDCSRLHLADVAACDTCHAWVVGNSEVKRDGIWTRIAVILSTSNGGATWRLRSLPRFASLSGVTFADGRRGWAVGEDARQLYGVILATDDGGTHWHVQARYKWASLQDVVCVGGAHVWAVGGPSQYPASALHPTPPMIVASGDGGAHWQVQLYANASTGSEMTGVDFVDSQHGWAIGGGGRGFVLATSDGGQTWRAEATGANKLHGLRKYSSVSFADVRHGWLVANNSELLATSDGGATWQAVVPPGVGHFLNVVYANGQGK